MLETASYSSTRVQAIFADIPATYERLNHLLTFRLDVLWRKRVARLAALYGGTRWVDMCTGTGETAAYLSRHATEGVQVHAVDFSEPMLREACKKPEALSIQFHVADIKRLPFVDNSFDVVTMSFATRNINVSREELVKSLTEYCRILKPGGRVVLLETSQPPIAVVRWMRDLYVKLLVAKVGGRISGSAPAYRYLSHTIPRFYDPAVFADIMREAGIGGVTFKRLLLGVAAIHEGGKPCAAL